MNCPRCGVAAAAGSRFCSQCGSTLDLTTSGARSASPPADGLSLVRRGSRATLTPEQLAKQLKEAQSGGHAERREVTVLCFDLADLGSINGVRHRDTLLAKISQTLQELVHIIQEYDGQLDKFTGDGLTALFGAPITHENDPERAVRAAFDMLGHLRPIQEQLKAEFGLSLPARMGIHTGPVIAGKMGSDAELAYTVVGDTVQLATDLQRGALPNTILVSHTTYQRTRPIFRFQAIPDLKLPGRLGPESAFRPAGLRNKPGRVRGLPGLQVPLVGRQQALDHLHERLKIVAEEGRTQMVLVTGNAGIGKSRLLLEFISSLAHQRQPVAIYSGSCQTHTRSRPYWVIAETIRDILNVSEEDQATLQLSRLRQHIRALGLAPDEVLPFLADLLGVASSDRQLETHLQLFDAGMLKKLAQVAFRSLLVAESEQMPAVVILDDLQWVDSASWETLLHLLQTTTRHPLMLVLIARSDWHERVSYLADLAMRYDLPFLPLELPNLSPTEGEMLVERLIPDQSPGTSALRRLVATRAQGNPFFTEEIVRMLIDEGGLAQREHTWHMTDKALTLLESVPGTVQGLILARFDTLNDAMQRALQVASVLGPSFPLSLITALSRGPAESTRYHLRFLETRQFLVLESVGPEAVFTFQHALVQETIYNTLLPDQRKQHHLLAAESIEAHPYWLRDSRQELLAFHFSRSSEPIRALPFLLNVAEEAATRFANETAVQTFRQALAIIREVAEPPIRESLRAQIGLAQALKFMGEYDEADSILGAALQALLNWSLSVSSSDLLPVLVNGLRELADIRQREGDYAAAIEHLEAALSAIGQPAGEMRQRLYRSVIERLVFVRFRQGHLDEALALAQSSLARMTHDETPDPVIAAKLYNTLGGIAWQQGDLASAINHVEHSLAIYEELNYIWGIASAFNNLGILYGQRGEWDKTIGYLERTEALRQEVGDIANQAATLANLGQLRLAKGEHQAARRDLQTGMAIFERLGDNWGIAKSNANLAQLALVENKITDAIRFARLALSLGASIGSQETLVQARWILALAQAIQGELETALDTASTGFQIAKGAGLADGELDCLRVLGVLHTQNEQFREAETYLREAIELSRQINDPYREGQALLDLGRLYLHLIQTRGSASSDWLSTAEQSLQAAVARFTALGASHDRQQAGNALAELTAIARMPESETDSATSGPATTLIDVIGGERRVATMLRLLVRLPEDMAEENVFSTLSLILPACSTIIQDYQGLVQQQADGLLAIFGVPVAFEDDAARAVEAANHIAQYVQQVQHHADVPLGIRLAVAQGQVVATTPDRPGMPPIIQGSPRQAVEQLVRDAPPNSIWVTDATRRSTEHQFVYRQLPASGEGPQPLYELVGLREEPFAARGLPGVQTRFIGREAPLQQIIDLSRNHLEGLGGIVWIEGEAGIGKTRLVREFRAAVGQREVTIWQGRCIPQGMNHAFSLVADLLGYVFGLHPSDRDQQIRDKIAQVVQSWPKDAQVTRPYLEFIAGLPPDSLEDDRLRQLEPAQLRQQSFVAMRRLLKTLAKRRPIILLLDDLHWIDPISAELLIFLATIVTSDPIMFVCAQRREGADAPNDRLVRLQSILPGQTTRLFLDRLKPEESRLLLAELLPGADLPDHWRETVVSRSEGNPYFLEEFVRMFIEHGYVAQKEGGWQVVLPPDAQELQLPASLELLLRSRVDALPSELRTALQAAVIIGREFDAELVARITADPGSRLALDRLAARLMLQQVPESDRWQFAHALLEAVVYESMLDTQRRKMHRQVAVALEERWQGSEAEHAKELAYHLSRAGDNARALPYLVLAGEQAAGRYANEEAIGHFQAAARVLEQLPGPDAKLQWRIAVGLGDVYRFVGKYAESMAVLKKGLPLAQTTQLFSDRRAKLYRRLGFTAQQKGDFVEARRHYTMVMEMLRGTNDRGMRIEASRALNGLAWVHFSQGQIEQAREACAESLAHAQAAESLNELATAENLLGGIFYQIGDWRAALQHTTRAMVLREQMGFTWGAASTLNNLGILAFMAGHWHKAVSFFQRSLNQRQEMGDVEGLVVTHNNLGLAYRGLGELAKAEEHFRQSLEIASLFNISYHIANASSGLAQVVLWQGRREQAEAILEAGIRQAQELGAQDVLAEALRVQAECCLERGELRQAKTVAQQAASLAQAVGNRSYMAAGFRVAAEAARRDGDMTLARALMEKARESLVDVTDELESGQVSAQAYRILRDLDQKDEAEREWQAAHEIFTRLGAAHFLHKLSAIT